MKKKIQLIREAIEFSQINDNIGLLSGQSGIALFHFYCSPQSNDMYEDKCLNYVESALSKINNGNQISSFCSGIAGFGWTLEFLRERNKFDQRDLLLLDELDSYLYKKMVADFSDRYYDYLHGGVGYGLYFLKRLYKPKTIIYLSELVKHIENISIIDTDGCLKWVSILDHENGLKGYNISLSHGMSSIIVVLSKIYKSGIEQETCKQLLIGAVKYILKQELDRKIYNSYFPSWSIESENKVSGSRLAWCYGDLGIGMALWQAGQILNISDWTEKAMEILLNSTDRKELTSNFVHDAGLCHGTAGIGHVFNRMFWNTKRMEFKTASEYWFDETLKMAYHSDGLAGFKTWHIDKFGGWVNELNLLEGISGIGLALNSWVNQIEPTWDECLLLS